MGDQERAALELHPSVTPVKAEQEKIETPAPGEAPGVEASRVKEPAGETPRDTSVAPMPSAQTAQPKDLLTEEIEDVLSEDLTGLYKQMRPEDQRQFKAEGERTAGLIRQMLSQGRLHARRVVGLIRAWLKLIPGVNRFFLAQEAKIKTDKILHIAEEKKNDV